MYLIIVLSHAYKSVKIALPRCHVSAAKRNAAPETRLSLSSSLEPEYFLVLQKVSVHSLAFVDLTPLVIMDLLVLASTQICSPRTIIQIIRTINHLLNLDVRFVSASSEPLFSPAETPLLFGRK